MWYNWGTMDDIERQKLELEIESKEIAVTGYFKSYSLWQRVAIIGCIVLAIPAFYGVKAISYAVHLSSYRKSLVTAHAAVVNPQQLQIVRAEALPIYGTAYSAYAIVKNPNTDLVSPNFAYTFTFYDASDNILTTAKGTSYITVSQQKYLIVPHVDSATKIAKVHVVIGQQSWERRLSLPQIQVVADVPQYLDGNDPPQFNITGNITNKSIFTLGTVNIDAVVVDKTGKEIAVTETTANTLAPGQVRAFQMYWPLPLAAHVAHVKIYPEFNLLDRSAYY